MPLRILSDFIQLYEVLPNGSNAILKCRLKVSSSYNRDVLVEASEVPVVAEGRILVALLPSQDEDRFRSLWQCVLTLKSPATENTPAIGLLKFGTKLGEVADEWPTES